MPQALYHERLKENRTMNKQRKVQQNKETLSATVKIRLIPATRLKHKISRPFSVAKRHTIECMLVCVEQHYFCPDNIMYK
jgi:hypothetical protein